MKYKYTNKEEKPIPKYKVGDNLYNPNWRGVEKVTIRKIKIEWYCDHYTINYIVKGHREMTPYVTSEDRIPECEYDDFRLSYEDEAEAFKIHIQQYLKNLKSELTYKIETAKSLGFDAKTIGLPEFKDE